VRSGQPGILRTILCGAGGWERIGNPLAVLSDDPGEPLVSPADGLEPLLAEFEIV
jgi:hypothetical protein